jgi:iron(III) transport system ATP-binding protein
VTTLRVNDLIVRMDDREILRGVDLDAADGELVAVVGPSGCGKTTLLRAIAGLVRASSGDIRLGDRLVATHGIHLAPERRRVGWVPQDPTLFPHLTVAQNVAFGMRSEREQRRTLRRRARDGEVLRLLDLVGLKDLADRLPTQLSGGQAQRVSLARALAARPSLVLLDEPFAALDPLLRHDLQETVPSWLRTEGVTGVMVTHDQSEALSIADRVAVMRAGHVLQQDAPATLFSRPTSAWVAGFIGDAVLLPGEWHDSGVATGIGRIPAAWGESDAAAPAPGAEVTAMLRPEQLVPVADPEGSCRVVRVRFTGHSAVVELLCDDGATLRARVMSPLTLTGGTRVRVEVTGTALAYRR